MLSAQSKIVQQQQVSCPTPGCDPAAPLRWPLELHLMIEAEREAAEVAAYVRGVEDARSAMQAALDSILDGHDAYGLTPPPAGARDVIQRMTRAMDRQARKLTALPGGRTAERRPGQQQEAA